MSAALSPERIQQRVSELGPWFHNLNLGGIQTAPEHFLGDYPAVKWQRFAGSIPPDLTGRSVLDIGCNAGFYAIEMKRRGADRVLGLDTDERYLAQARFAAEVEGADIEFRRMSVYELPSLGERFDLVLFMGVLYHLRHPLLALDILHEHVVGDMLVFQSMLRGSADAASRRPGLRVLADRTLRGAVVSADVFRRAQVLAVTRPTGGSRIARAQRQCCAAPDSRSSRTRRRKCSCAAAARATCRDACGKRSWRRG